MDQENWKLAKHLQHKAVVHGQGLYKIMPDETALEIVGAAQKEKDFYLLGNPLKKQQEMAPTFTCWARSINEPTLTPMPVEELPLCDNGALNRAECNDNQKTVFLLLALKKILFFE